MVKVDLHLHTNRYSPCSRLSPEELSAIAPFSGLDGIVITEHNFQWTREECREYQEKLGGVRIYRAMEASVPEGHFLIYGAEIKERWDQNKPLAYLIDFAREQNAALVWAHPGRFVPLPSDFEESLALDGVEVMSANIQEKHRRGISRVLASLRKPSLAGSDSHVAMTVGSYATVFPELPADEKDLARMIKAPLGVPWVNRKAVIPLNSKYREDEEKLLLSAPRPD